jgi:hypothetical protein
MLSNQRYVSNELTHFVGRGKVEEEQYGLLVHILKSGWLTHPPHNPQIDGNIHVSSGTSISANQMYSPQIVCFCDIPIQDLHIHIAKYSPFGLALSKDLVVRQGGTPVLYLPLNTSVRASRGLTTDEITRATSRNNPDDIYREIPLCQLFDRMVPEYRSMMNRFEQLIMQASETRGVPEEFRRLSRLRSFIDFHLISYLKFFDHTLPDDDPNNFYMEREWRVVGNVYFTLSEVIRVFVPKRYGRRFRLDVPQYEGQISLSD